MAHIYSDYKEALEERSSLLARRIRHDRPQTGYVQYRGDYSDREAYLNKVHSIMEETERRYNRYLMPVLKVDKALMDNAASMFCYREPAVRMVYLAVTNSLTIPEAGSHINDKSTA